MSKMRSRWILVLMAAVWAIASVGCASTGAANGSSASSAPGIEATDIDGRFFSLGDHLGQDVVLVSFWATWCEPCKAEMPSLQRLYDKYKGDGLVVLSVSTDGSDTRSRVRPYIKTNGYSFPVVVDEDSAIQQGYNPAATVPFLVFIGRDGKIAKQISGFQPAEAAAMEAEIRQLLGLDS